MLALIHQRQEILVEELCRIFNISAMTARRDLQALEEQGKISRFHGGATVEVTDAVSSERAGISICRSWIARYAASLVEDGDRILINGSDTALALLDYLDGRRVTVYTNTGHAIDRHYPEDIDLQLFGGTVRASHILTGDLTLRNLMDVRADKAFLGCTGISPAGEILCGIPSELGINETLISHAEQYFILADHSKIGRSSPYASFLLEKPGCIVTDELAPLSVTERLRERGMEVVRVGEASFGGADSEPGPRAPHRHPGGTI